MSTTPGEVLALVALSPTASAVAREASRLAASLGWPLRLLHVGRPGPDLTELVRRALPDEAPEVLARSGRIEEVVAETAATARLLVLGALEEEGPLGSFFSSVGRRVARSAPCPTLLLPQPRLSPAAFRRIVAVMDPKTPSREMLESVLDLARAEKAEILHVVQEFELPGLHLALEEGADLAETEEERQVGALVAEHRLANFLEDCRASGVPTRASGLPGREGLEAISFARDTAADLLVVPAPEEHSGLLDRLYPHGTELTLQNLPCALLVWRPHPSS